MRRAARIAEAAVALTLARGALRILPFRWLARGAGGPEPVGGTGPEPRAAAIGRAIDGAAARLPWGSTCLVRALAGRMMLVRRGVPSVLWLGVAKDGGTIRAHAWLAAGGGVVCGGREAPGYTPIATVRTGRRP